MSEAPVVVVEGGVKQLPAMMPLLTRIDLQVRAGTSVSILGRSGSGKSTLLGLLGLLNSFDGGTYLLDGEPVPRSDDRAADRLRSRALGFVFQRFCLLPHLTALENVEAPLLLVRQVSARMRRDRAARWLERVGLAPHAQKRPHQLSGGEQQRVAIARALVGEPRVVLADEPTASLDPATASSVLDLLFEQVHLHGAALIIVTHDPVIAARASRTLFLDHGELHPRTPA